MNRLLVRLTLLFFTLVTPAQAMLIKANKSLSGKFCRRLSCPTNSNFILTDILGLKNPGSYRLDGTVERCCELLKDSLHCDPEPGSSWSACQVTAATSIGDFAVFDRGERPESLIVRFLLNVNKDGSSPDTNEVYERITALSLDKLMPEKFSKSKARKLIKPLQQWLRKDMAEKLHTEIIFDQENNQYLLRDRSDAFNASINALKAYKTKIALVVYPGTPTLSEVRSLIGAEHFIPFAYCESKKSYALDTNNQYLHFCHERIEGGFSYIRKIVEVDLYNTTTYIRRANEEEYQKGLKTNMVRWKIGNSVEADLHIVARSHCVNTPKEDDSYFLLHTGFSEITSEKIENGTMVSHLELIDFDPIQFMINRFDILNKNTKIDQKIPDDLPFSQLSLFHFSYAPAYKSVSHLKLPNEYLHPSHHDYYHGWLPSRKIENHGFLIYENTSRHPFSSLRNPLEEGTSIYKMEKNVRFAIRLVFNDDRSINTDKSYLTIDLWKDNNAELASNLGAFEKMLDKELKLKLAKKFIESLKVYHQINFCPGTRLKLNENGLNLQQLDSIYDSLDSWLR